jgi:hypothetical protein
METRQMHKSLLLQHNKFNIRHQKKNKENERPHHRTSLQDDHLNQKFKSILNNKKTNLNPHQLKQMKGFVKENHSCVNITDKENYMNHANSLKENYGQNRMGNSNILRQNGVQKMNNLNVSISNQCHMNQQVHTNNTTSLHNLSELQETSKDVFNNNKNQHVFPHKKNIFCEEIQEETLDLTTRKQFNKINNFTVSTNDCLSEILRVSDNDMFGAQRRCDPIEFSMDNIDSYYNSIIAEKGKNGSIACGGDIFRIQSSLKENMRIILFDWLLDLCQKWKMKLRTFIITITFIDAVLIRCTVTKDIFQLVGLACLFIAGKFEEIYPPSLEEYLESCNNAFSRDQLLQIETIILNAIQFNLVILNHLDILELNLKQKLKINNKSIKIYASDLTQDENEIITKINNLSEMFLMICLYSHQIHFLNMNNVVDFCIINAIRFINRQNHTITYKGISSNCLETFSLKGKDLVQFIHFIPGFSIDDFLEIEKIMKKMMKTVFDSRQYSIIIKYRQFFVKTLKTYFDMI